MSDYVNPGDKCERHSSRDAVEMLRRVGPGGGAQMWFVCQECYDTFVVDRYPRSGRAVEARARLAGGAK